MKWRGLPLPRLPLLCKIASDYAACIPAGPVNLSVLAFLAHPRHTQPHETRMNEDSIKQYISNTFTALDTIMPHPVYGKINWACVLNPSAATFEAVRPLLAEAYQLVFDRYAKREARG